jgi:hypothetical protein
MKTMEEEGVGICPLACNTLGVERRVGASRQGLGQMISGSIIHINLHKLNNIVEAFLMHDEPQAHTDLEDSPQLVARAWGKPPPPLYSIFYD